MKYIKAIILGGLDAIAMSIVAAVALFLALAVAVAVVSVFNLLPHPFPGFVVTFVLLLWVAMTVYRIIDDD